MLIYFRTIVFIFGLVFGSFLNCTSMRICRNQDFVRGKSHCMHCGHDLAAIDLIPVVSFISTGGKCRYCKKKISVRYPLTEISFGLLTLVMYVAVIEKPLFSTFSMDMPNMVLFIRNMILTGCLFVIALTDLEAFEIPDGCILTGIIIWIISSPFVGGADAFSKENFLWIMHHIISGLLMLFGIMIFTLVIEKFLKRDALGGGDIKLFAMLALYLGYAGSYELIILSCVTGLVFAGIRNRMNPSASKEFPFGPAIAFSGYWLLICSDTITNWYFSLLT